MAGKSLNQIRNGFLKYFEKNGHRIVESSNLVPDNDPTLMFANSGMVQFKNVFTGLEKRDYKTATTSQKCVRAGGKHNDLENVGYTPRHHTFFEMLGNFSFGDYFKEKAISLAWDLITKEFGISKDKLYVTVFKEDDDAFNLWKKVAGLNDNRVIRIATSDNFWSMGEPGPCGTCSDIFYEDSGIKSRTLNTLRTYLDPSGIQLSGDVPQQCTEASHFGCGSRGQYSGSRGCEYQKTFPRILP